MQKNKETVTERRGFLLFWVFTSVDLSVSSLLQKNTCGAEKVLEVVFNVNMIFNVHSMTHFFKCEKQGTFEGHINIIESF